MLNRHRHKIIYFLFFMVVFMLITTYVQGKEQDAQYKKESVQYELAVQRLSEQKGEEAVRLLQELVEGRYSDSYEVLWKYGLANSLVGEYDLAAKQLLEAQNIRPALITNSLFMVQFGEVHFHNKDYKNAEIYLKEALKLSLEKELRSSAETLLEQIQLKKLESGKMK